MKLRSLPTITLSLVIHSLAATAQVTHEVSPGQFAVNGKINEDGLVDLLLCRMQVPYSQLIDAETGRYSAELRRKAVEDRLGPLKAELKTPPWSVNAVIDALRDIEAASNQDSPPFGIRMPGLTTNAERVLTGGRTLEVAGLRLRRNPDQFAISRADADGATLTWSDNRLVEGGGSWNSEGVLGYPIRLHDPKNAWDFTATPAVSWKLLQEEGIDGADIRDLEFSLPFTALMQLPTRGHVAVVGRPYYHTDFDLEGGIAGATLTFDWAADLGVPFGMYKTVPGFKKLAWNWTFNPQIDWSEVIHESRWSDREQGDDWMRAGAVAGVAFRPWGKGKFECSATYRFLCGITGAPNYSDLLSIKASTWFTEEVGLSLEYQRGTTPVSDKDLDLLTLGLEIRL